MGTALLQLRLKERTTRSLVEEEEKQFSAYTHLGKSWTSSGRGLPWARKRDTASMCHLWTLGKEHSKLSSGSTPVAPAQPLTGMQTKEKWNQLTSIAQGPGHWTPQQGRAKVGSHHTLLQGPYFITLGTGSTPIGQWLPFSEKFWVCTWLL